MSAKLHKKLLGLSLGILALLQVNTVLGQDSQKIEIPKKLPKTPREHAVAKLLLFDANGDHKLAKEEITAGPMKVVFAKADANGDNFLDLKELTELSKKLRWSEAVLQQIESTVKKYDANKNGTLSAAEAKGTRLSDLKKNDLDGDGSLSKFEVAIAIFQSRQRNGVEGNGKRNSVEMRKKMSKVIGIIRKLGTNTTDDDVKHLLAQDDTNKDGKIGKGDAKIRPNLKRFFARFDKDSDGFLDAAELKDTGLRPYSGKLFIKAFDVDKDNQLSKKEAVVHPALELGFKRYDSDGDGFLNKNELDKMRGGILFNNAQGAQDY